MKKFKVGDIVTLSDKNFYALCISKENVKQVKILEDDASPYHYSIQISYKDKTYDSLAAYEHELEFLSPFTRIKECLE